jgi:hypothetical protein
MIYFRFSIDNPFRDTSADRKTKDYFYYDEPIKFWKHKYLSLQVSKFGYGNIFNFDFDLSPRAQDHGGLRMTLGLFDYDVIFNIYDNRHWNYDKNRWVDYDNEDEVAEYL